MTFVGLYSYESFNCKVRLSLAGYKRVILEQISNYLPSMEVFAET